MTSDIVALVRHRPDIPTVVDGMIAFGVPVRPYQTPDGGCLLYDTEGRMMVAIETPLQVGVAGEAERLLGPEVAQRGPSWWVEVRAAPDVPDALRVARRFADDIVWWQGGMVWPN